MPEWTSVAQGRMPARLAPLALAVTIAAGCGGEDPSAQIPDDLSAEVTGIRTLSNDADLISGGDALVEVELGSGIDPDTITVQTVEGRDVTDAFEMREDGRFVGLVEDLDVGETQLRAFGFGGPGSGETLTITNHPSSGPIFSGPHLEPWICARPNPQEIEITDPETGRSAMVTPRESGLNEPPDAECRAPAVVEYFFEPVSAPEDCVFTIPANNDNACFEPFDPDNPPAEDQIADFTNDRGDTVASIIAVERGTINRGMYELVVFHDPREPNNPAERQEGWNRKLLFFFGGAAGGSRFQEPPGSPFFNEAALERGYMLARSSLNDNVNNYNHALAAETVMMLKEHIIENWGEIRFTIGSGASGGAIQQLTMASSYPGLLDGLLPALTFADSSTTSIEVGDCGLLLSSETDSGMSLLNELGLARAENNAISGITSDVQEGFSQCQSWVAAFLSTGDPTNASACGGLPEDLMFDPQDNPEGVSCTLSAHNRNLVGTITTDSGLERSPQPIDNVGVQYGLRALQNGVITEAEFVELNERIGHYDINQNLVRKPEGETGVSDREADVTDGAAGLLPNYYRSGMVTDGKELDRVPIVERRANLNSPEVGSILNFHANWRSMMIRQRLEEANGHHDNHIILGEDTSANANAGAVSQSTRVMALDLMDEWLTNIETDIRNGAADRETIERNERRDADRQGFQEVLPGLVVENRPGDAQDRCFVPVEGGSGLEDVGLGSEECPLEFKRSPLQVAGGPRAEDNLKCQLEPLDFSSSEYDGISFTQPQRDTLNQVFPDGVCDWSQPGVGEQMPLVWPSFESGPGGQALGPAPQSS